MGACCHWIRQAHWDCGYGPERAEGPSGQGQGADGRDLQKEQRADREEIM